jgi:hypothetical protein
MSALVMTNKSHTWRQRILQQQASGLSIIRWCEQNQVSYNTFTYWKRRLWQPVPINRTAFLEIKEKSPQSGIHLESGGIKVHLEKDFDAATLAKVLGALKEARC